MPKDIIGPIAITLGGMHGCLNPKADKPESLRSTFEYPNPMVIADAFFQSAPGMGNGSHGRPFREISNFPDMALRNLRR